MTSDQASATTSDEPHAPVDEADEGTVASDGSTMSSDSSIAISSSTERASRVSTLASPTRAPVAAPPQLIAS
jgi:hypothetical protein